MALRKIAKELIFSTHNRQYCGYQIKLRNLNQSYHTSSRNVFRSSLLRGVELVSTEDLNLKTIEGRLPLIETKQKKKPLVLLFTWMGCTPKQSDKFLQLYLNKGFDVVLVTFFTREVIWWNQSNEKKASIILDFLHQNEAYEPIVYHGFSIGNGLWTSMLWEMSQNEERHRPLANRIKGQIWDSVTQTSNLIRNACYAAFPTNRKMGQLLYRIVRVLPIADTNVVNNMEYFYKRNNFIFNNPPFKIPSLLFCSKGDIYSELDGVLTAFENWKSIGMQAYIKYWEKSKHVGHFFLHNQEYVETINFFLKSIGVEKHELSEVIAPYEILKIQIPKMKL